MVPVAIDLIHSPLPFHVQPVLQSPAVLTAPLFI